jgi:hypothetical protein
MVIWSGWGFVIVVLAFASLVFTEIGVERVYGDSDYYQAHGWPKMLALLIAAAVSIPLGRLMNHGADRDLIDPETMKRVVVTAAPRHTLFFLPVQHWWMAFVGLSMVALFL